MKSDTLIKSDGMRILTENMGIVEAERFITLMLRDPFDYTEWQRNLYKDIPLNDLYRKVKSYERENMDCED